MLENQRRLASTFMSTTKIKGCCGLGNTFSRNKHLVNNMISNLTLVGLPGPQMADGLCIS